MKKPQFEQASFTYTYNEIAYNIMFTPQSGGKWNIKVVNVDSDLLILSQNKASNLLNANRSNAIYYLSVALGVEF